MTEIYQNKRLVHSTHSEKNWKWNPNEAYPRSEQFKITLTNHLSQSFEVLDLLEATWLKAKLILTKAIL